MSQHEYAQGGYVKRHSAPEGMVPVELTRGTVLMSLASYRALSPEMRARLFETPPELIISAAEVRELGAEGLQKLLEELNDVPD